MTPILCPPAGLPSFVPFLNRGGLQHVHNIPRSGNRGDRPGRIWTPLDAAFEGIDGVEVVAVADHDPKGLAAAGDRLGVSRLYSDYRRMLAAEKPDLVSIAPSWVTERVPMVEAAAAAGCHIYCEKPAAGSLADVDRIEAACRRAKVEMAVAHQWRAMPPVQKAIEEVKAGRFGKLLRIRGRPKDGGGEELLLHGTHMFDLMMAFAGEPRWASGHVTVGNRDATRDDAGQGTAPVGPVLGDSISAVFGFDEAVRGFFDSTANLAVPGESSFDHLFGLSLECERRRWNCATGRRLHLSGTSGTARP